MPEPRYFNPAWQNGCYGSGISTSTSGGAVGIQRAGALDASEPRAPRLYFAEVIIEDDVQAGGDRLSLSRPRKLFDSILAETSGVRPCRCDMGLKS